MNPPQRFVTERLILHTARGEDAPVVFEAFLAYSESMWHDGKDFSYAITLKVNSELGGMFGLHPMKKKIEVGYVLALPYWGKGYMTEALRAVISWALSRPDVFRVQAVCDVENPGSARVMEKAGMQREGLLRRYILHPNLSPEPRDCFIYAAVR